MDPDEENLELRVIRLIRGAWRSRETLEAEYPELADAIDEDRVMLLGWSSTVRRQGMVLAYLAMFPSTKVELEEQMAALPEAVPAWSKPNAGEEPMTWTLFMRGLAQALAVQREAIERVAREQVEEPDPIWEALAEALVPRSELATQSELIEGVGGAITAHLKALVAIAGDLEGKARAYLN